MAARGVRVVPPLVAGGRLVVPISSSRAFYPSLRGALSMVKSFPGPQS